MAYPNWKDMSVEQRLDFLHDWCDNLAGAIRDIKAEISRMADQASADAGRPSDVPRAEG